MDLKLKQKLIKEKTHAANMEIKRLEAQSVFPFGRWTRGGSFVYDQKKVPNYEIPDLKDFKLLPYVSFKVPTVSEETKAEIKKFMEVPDVPKSFNLVKGNKQIIKTESTEDKNE